MHTAIAYEGAGLELVRRFKFELRRDARELLVAWLAERVRGLAFDVIVPVPRHVERVRREGCDPVHELAAQLSRRAVSTTSLRLPRAKARARRAGGMDRAPTSAPEENVMPDDPKKRGPRDLARASKQSHEQRYQRTRARRGRSRSKSR